MATSGQPAGRLRGVRFGRPAALSGLTVRRAGRLAAPAAVFLAVRLVGVVVLALTGRSLPATLVRWDGHWFLGLARGGYAGVDPTLVDAFGDRYPDTALAFFPGYPALVAAAARLSGDVLAAGLLVAVLAGVAAAYGLVRLGELVPGGSRRAGLVLVALFAAAPMAVVLSMTYSEGLFCALAAWALVGVLRRQWLLAGGCAAAAGLVRPTAAALVLAVAAAAAVAVLGRRDGWRPWAAVALAPVGLLGYLGYVAVRTGSVDGWFALQRRGWGSAFDGGASTWRFALATLRTGRSVLEVATVAVLAGAVVLLVVCLLRRVPWPLVVYGAAVLVMDLGSGGLANSKARLLVPAFTLLLPVALGLARRRTATVLAVLAGAALVSAWLGSYALTAWPYAI